MALKKTLMKMGLVEEDVVPSTARPTTRTIPTPPPLPQTLPRVDEEISKALQKSLEDNKLSGFDYLKFISTVEEMSSYGMPEEARYKMAFTAAKQVGVSKDTLLQSGSHYLTVLSHDEEAFNAECDQFEKKELQKRESRTAELQSTIASLNQQLREATQEQSDLVAELATKRRDLEEKRAAFQTTLQSLVKAIQSNMSKINSFLS